MIIITLIVVGFILFFIWKKDSGTNSSNLQFEEGGKYVYDYVPTVVERAKEWLGRRFPCQPSHPFL